MKAGGPIIMRRCSGFPLAVAVSLALDGSENPPIGLGVAISVAWSERPGKTETFFSETWNCIAPNMWLAMSQKK